MRIRPVALALLLAFAPVAAALPARAQNAADDPTTDIARARFKEGVGFYDKAQYEQARVSFLQAYALKKHPAVLLNLAWSCLKSGHTLEAEHYFKQFLTESKDITDKQKSDAVDGLSQAHAKLGRIEVVAAAGTDVTIDGDKAGTAPLPEPIIVEPGAHTIKFRGPDGTTDTDSVTVLAGEKAIAHFAKTASAAPAATTATAAPAPSNPDSDSTTPAPAPPEETPAPEAKPPVKESSDHESHSGFVVPIVVASVVTVGGAILAGVMAASKSNAQGKANDIAGQIRGHGGTSCNPPTPSSLTNIAEACNQFVADNNDVNTDATVGNIAVGVAVVGAVAVVGLVVWDILSPPHHDNASASRTSTPKMTPMIGRDLGGLTLSGSF
jgi:hypothetical protein